MMEQLPQLFNFYKFLLNKSEKDNDSENKFSFICPNFCISHYQSSVSFNH